MFRRIRTTAGSSATRHTSRCTSSGQITTPDSNPVEQIFEHLQDGEPDEALRLLDSLLELYEDHPGLHALRARILIATGLATRATPSVKRALALGPKDSYVQRTAAELWLALEEPAFAISAARQALALDADDHEAIILEARARALLGQWDQVVTRADYVLMFEPTNEGAAILRAVALASKKGNKGTLGTEDWEQLARAFPATSAARAGHAWTLLQRGRQPAAVEEFKQALVLDPTSEFAKEGMVAALKAQYPAYGLLLKYFFWMLHQSPRTRTLVIVGGLVGFSFLRRMARENPELEPVIMPVLLAYAFFILMTWLADPLLSLALMVHVEGRQVLSDDDRKSGLLVGGCLGAAILLGVVGGLTGWDAAMFGSLSLGAATFTVAGAFKCAPGTYRSRLLSAAIVFVTLGLASTVVPGDTAKTLVVIVVVGAIISTWIARSWAEASHA